MVPLAFSIPQLITKQIFDVLLNESGKYNDRQTIKPLELDVFYKNINFAVEYCGKRWHGSDAAKRDEEKIQACKRKNITLLKIVERSRNYEEDIKGQIKENLHILPEAARRISEIDVDAVRVNYDKIFQLYDIELIKKHVAKCVSIPDFQKKFMSEYRVLAKLKRLDVLSPIRIFNINVTDQQILDEAKKFNVLSDFVKFASKWYQLAFKRKILDVATKHMIRKKPMSFSKQDILALTQNFRMNHPDLFRGGFKSMYPAAYKAALRMGLLDIMFPMSTRPTSLSNSPNPKCKRTN
jgi:hypothetical protein